MFLKMKENNNFEYTKIRTGFLCLCTLMVFCMDFEQPCLKVDFFSMTIMFAALYYADIKIGNMIKYKNYLQNIINIIIAFLWLVSKAFSIDNTTLSLHNSPIQIVKSIIYVIGVIHLLNRVGMVVHELIITKDKSANSTLKGIRLFVLWFVSVLAVWLPHTIISHPASMECDAWDSLYQYFGKAEFTAHHPPVFTVLLGWFASFGLKIENINTAFFLWTLLQTIICAAIMAYVFVCMEETLHAPYWLLILSFLIAAVSPFYTCYVTTIVKDTMYSFAFLLYLIELIYMHINWKKYWDSIGHVCLFCLSNMIMLLFRHNGKYIIYVMIIYIIIKWIRNRAELPGKCNIKCIIMLILPVLFSNAILYAVISQYHVTVQDGESMREALSIPFQQSARYAQYYGDETPEEEKTVIDKVIDYYALASVYEPEISDPVKSRFHYYATKEDWVDYFKVWLKQFSRHPLTYIGATINQNYCLIYPQRVNSRFYYSIYVDYFYDHGFMDEMGAAQEMTFARANDARIALYGLIHALPVTGAFSNIAAYNIIILYLVSFCIKDKKKGFLWIMIPISLSDLIVLAGPAIYDNVRYALPVVYSVPITVAYYIYCNKRANQE